MPLKDIFNGDLTARKVNDFVLQVGNGVWGCSYDFRQRLLLTGNGGVMPFSQIDREVLVAVHDKLVELGGHPPELPVEEAAGPSKSRKFNL